MKILMNLCFGHNEVVVHVKANFSWLLSEETSMYVLFVLFSRITGVIYNLENSQDQGVRRK